ncbi:MAG: hypothetical protein KAX25_04390 [Dehalococcoidia bacterium]|nr:hypothetical protein [Chloroflexota bacterium]MCK4222088.1 hypothetical protein [Dehalococcoidia bacterium]
MRTVKVQCYSGHTYAQEPRSFSWQGKDNKIDSVERAWQEPGKRSFQVVTGDRKLFELSYNEETDLWSAIELGVQEKA